MDRPRRIVALGGGGFSIVTSRPDAAAYRVELVDGSVRETRLATRYLGG